VSELFVDLAGFLADLMSEPHAKTGEALSLERLGRLFTAIASQLDTTWDIEVVDAQLVHMLVSGAGSIAVAGVVGASPRAIADELPQPLGREVFISAHDRKIAVTRYRETPEWLGGAEVFEVPEEEWLLLLAAQDAASLASLSTVVRTAIDAME
jgi:hypothetical protein